MSFGAVDICIYLPLLADKGNLNVLMPLERRRKLNVWWVISIISIRSDFQLKFFMQLS